VEIQEAREELENEAREELENEANFTQVDVLLQ